jgi:hydroxymethylpyrimidine/phosphomethylpyrimidine kinase
VAVQAEKRARPTALTVAGSDSSGGAGLQADLKTFLGCGVHGMSAVTAVTVQNSRGVSGVYKLPPAAVAEQIEALVDDIGVGAVKTGMLASAGVVDTLATVLARVDAGPLVVDPVVASQHGDPLLPQDAVEALVSRLLPLATLVTPNLPEVRVLTGLAVRHREEMEDAARAVHALGPRWVLVKGGHLSGASSADLLFDGESCWELEAPRRDTAHTHGGGDTLAAAICAGLARGLDVPDAVAAGKRYVTEAVADSYQLGRGLGPVGHFWRVREWAWS